jgi:hypothetical protein
MGLKSGAGYVRRRGRARRSCLGWNVPEASIKSLSFTFAIGEAFMTL